LEEWFSGGTFNSEKHGKRTTDYIDDDYSYADDDDINDDEDDKNDNDDDNVMILVDLFIC